MAVMEAIVAATTLATASSVPSTPSTTTMGRLVVGGAETIATSSETERKTQKKWIRARTHGFHAPGCWTRVGLTRLVVGSAWRRVRRRLATKFRRGGRRWVAKQVVVSHLRGDA
ncbi:hypothetical protein TSUD_153950 [Trifolium subterraneum]|uniref:Uncharacterized protein n=1 Tax=Trifolium subterraneum TaxID=3900 RepID=A0A2Z6NLS2_TRISU|nr:hypothetical protein TSUD_153950 [Trifolium subterraneum]